MACLPLAKETADTESQCVAVDALRWPNCASKFSILCAISATEGNGDDSVQVAKADAVVHGPVRSTERRTPASNHSFPSLIHRW